MFQLSSATAVLEPFLSPRDVPLPNVPPPVVRVAFQNGRISKRARDPRFSRPLARSVPYARYGVKVSQWDSPRPPRTSSPGEDETRSSYLFARSRSRRDFAQPVAQLGREIDSRWSNTRERYRDRNRRPTNGAFLHHLRRLRSRREVEP